MGFTKKSSTRICSWRSVIGYRIDILIHPKWWCFLYFVFTFVMHVIIFCLLCHNYDRIMSKICLYGCLKTEWPYSWLQLPTKLARMTGKHGLISLKGHDAAENGRTRSCMEGVRLLNIFIKMLRFLSQYWTLPSVKKRWGWGLPL